MPPSKFEPDPAPPFPPSDIFNSSFFSKTGNRPTLHIQLHFVPLAAVLIGLTWEII